MNQRIPLDHLTSDALDALYERLEAAEQTESERQLATAREALASATTRAARAEAALARIQALADEHPASIDTALIHETLDQLAATQVAECRETEPNTYRQLLSRLETDHDKSVHNATHAAHNETRLSLDGIAAGLHIAIAHTITVFEGHEARQAYLADTGPATTQATDVPPSRRAGLHDQIVNTLGQIPTIPPAAHRRAQADNVIALLYREWPWLRAAAEDAGWLHAGTRDLSIPEETP